MKLSIELPVDHAKESIIILKNYIDKASINGVDENEIDTVKINEGEMGAGALLNSITMIIDAAEKPLIELVKCLQKYVDNYRTKILIPSKNGTIEIIHGRSMKPDQLKEVVVAILESKSLEDE